MKKLTLLIAFLIISFQNQANAKPYIDKNIITPNLIDQPLTVGSKEWKNEIKTIINLQKDPDQKQIDQALSERNFKPETLVEAVDPTITRTSHPKLYQILDNIGDNTGFICSDIKIYWNTKRPYIMDKNIKALITAYDNPSYPSTHTTKSYVFAHILGSLVPEKRQQFQGRAAAIAHRQILVGMNYPHDIRGGKQLSLLIMDILLKNAEFQKDFQLAKKEFVTH